MMAKVSQIIPALIMKPTLRFKEQPKLSIHSPQIGRVVRICLSISKCTVVVVHHEKKRLQNINFLQHDRLMNRFDLSSAHHKEMLAVLAAVTEVIKANGGKEDTIEYFAALVSTSNFSHQMDFGIRVVLNRRMF